MQTYWGEIKELADKIEAAWEKEDFREVFRLGAKLTTVAYELMKEVLNTF